MKAWWVEAPSPIASGPLRMGERPDPSSGPGEVLLSVRACGVCRTDPHLAEADVRPRAARRIPGHDVVTEVVGLGAGSSQFRLGERVGAAWLARTHCGLPVDKADQALLDFSRDRYTGVAVLLRSACCAREPDARAATVHPWVTFGPRRTSGSKGMVLL